MKKIVAGFVAAVLLLISAEALGSSVSLIGKKIQAEFIVTIYGKKLADPAIVIDGKSYAPVRAIGELAGFDVTVADKTINFEERSKPSGSTSDRPDPAIIDPMQIVTPNPAIAAAKIRINAIDAKINAVVNNILTTRSMLKLEPYSTPLKNKLRQYQGEYDKLLQQKQNELQK
ncbi:hypothetical protein [Paenibacillus donghaensis]|uniref:Copper amine oxidase-like N-terminal domain-containing protein n=1 Tax=Paenibacillus donghaensis TaxID=414771 RepID=A0A2Z2KP14_9BACL|nr:hypothetical protein [Paenibacillus donghaensis]ASA21911.1 hypothetical protein B9T62_14670 [Paenibacillus donghaensis]